ncbi:MAG: hypothetical protein AAFQ21_13255 [Pseudomonadota bacterium]
MARHPILQVFESVESSVSPVWLDLMNQTCRRNACLANEYAPKG